MGEDFSTLARRLRCCARCSAGLPGTRCGWARCERFPPPYLLPSFGLPSPDCCCGICRTHGPAEVLGTPGVVVGRGAVGSSVVYWERFPCPSPWWYTYGCEEDLIRNWLIHAAILRGSFQRIPGCEGADKHVLHHSYILVIQRIYQKMPSALATT